MKTLLVIDGNSILNRQYYGIRPLCTKSGLYTNAVFGFTKVLLSQIETLSPAYVAVAFDLKEKTFRHAKYAAYKAGRHATPEELLMQFPYAKRMVTALGGTVLSKGGYEADDILGTLGRMAEETEEAIHTYILTGDRDSLQLIDATTTVLLAGNHEVAAYDETAFYDKYGVKPAQFVDVKALMGDSSDNIPGVAGIGEKTALKLIAAKESLDALYADVEALSVTPSVKKKLTDGREAAYLSQELARIDRHVPLELTLSDIAVKEPDREALRVLFNELEFTAFDRLLAEASPLAGVSGETQKEGAHARPLTVEALLSKAFSSPLSLWREGETLYLAEGEEIGYRIDNLDDKTLLSFLLSHKGVYTVYDQKAWLHRLGAVSDGELPHFAFDVLLAAYVLDAASGSYDMAKLSVAYLGEGFSASDPARALARVASALSQKLVKEGTDTLYRDIEHPLAEVLYKMETRGFLVDRPMLAAFSNTLDLAAEGYMAEIYRYAGKTFNINSPKQLGEVLFETLSLPVFKKNKSGYSTDAEVLEKLRPYHPIIDLITEYRQAVKFKATYADALGKAADENGRVHTSFNQTVTATGRLSSTEPNLQNIPVRTELGRELRRAFIAREGFLLVDADYSQIELRLLAALSQDERMIEAFRSGVDIHAVTASQVFGVPLEEVTSELRKRAKAVNFGIVYGIGGFSLAGDIGVSVKEASQYIKSYKETYCGVDAFLARAVEEAKQNGFVTTLFGRRRYIPEFAAQKASLKSFGERVAMNSPIQGTAADIIKIAMLRVEKALQEAGLSAKLILQVHDELIIEAPEREAEEAAAILKREMESAVSLAVPLTVEVNIGRTWYDCK